jgi:hypothetical protein
MDKESKGITFLEEIIKESDNQVNLWEKALDDYPFIYYKEVENL